MPKKSDLLMAVGSIMLALWVTSGFWIDPNGKASFVNSGDQALFEWLLSYGAYAVTHGVDPLFTYLLNVPDGVNLSVNTSITVYAVAFAPLTMWLGAPVTFLVILTLNLAGTAFAWYWLFNRHLHATPLGAAIGGLFCGFAPAMISHANAHLNWTAQWLVPLIIARVIVLYRRSRPVKDGVILGLLVAACFSIAAEALFFSALALAVFSIFWVLIKRPPITNVLKGLGTAALVAGVFLAYPLWLHFAGPQRYHGTGFDPKVHNEDLAAYGVWPERSVAGALGLNTHLAPNPTEENSFFGLPLLVLVIFAFVLLWKRTEVKGLALTATLFILLSLGPELRLFGRLTGVWMPEALLNKLPIFNAALPSRLALVVAPIFGLMLAWLISSPKPFPKPVWIAAFAAALVPLFPLPALARDREPVPHFFTAGTWKSYVDGREPVIAPVPLPNDLVPDGQRWQAVALAQGNEVFRLPSGFFLGPGGPNGTGRIGPIPRPTADLLEKVAKTGELPAITDADRARAKEDLRYWDAQIVVLADTVSGAHWDPNQPALLKVMTDLLGPPQRVDDVWLWRI
ncbi:MAG TPA: DUF2079 domain-containing protein [Micromonosporaceae bacterium]|nr:DUF2079 domain-containing protein [Micromonosporaceae bacterium]HCU50199.1 DUF2079 domain-containing protein [Micromonosporaceae bacterium]